MNVDLVEIAVLFDHIPILPGCAKSIVSDGGDRHGSGLAQS